MKICPICIDKAVVFVRNVSSAIEILLFVTLLPEVILNPDKKPGKPWVYFKPVEKGY